MRGHLVDWSNLKADYERLGSYSAVARQYGVSKAYVAQQAKRFGLDTGRPRALDIDWSELPTLYASGMTYEQLTAHFGCSVHAVQNAMKRLGVTARPTGTPKGYEWTDARRQAHQVATSTPEFRAKSRENLLRRLPTMRGPSANSPLERLLQTALINAGISFSTQRVLLGRYCVDILLEQAPVVIEADGALHYLRKAQDAERDAALKEAGYRVFRFTGSEINADPAGCVRTVVETCFLTPEDDPVADIRNGMSGTDNPNWAGGARTITCDQCGAEFREKQRNARSSKKKFCDSTCYGAWLRDHPEANNRRLRIDWSDLPAQYAAGMTMAQLRSHYGVGLGTVRRAMQRLGVEPRSAGEHAALRQALPQYHDEDTVRAAQ